MSGLKRRILLRSHAENAARAGVHEARSEDDPLTCFLRRHPFSSHALLEGVFGEKGITMLLEKESRQLRHVSIPGVSPCYALMKEPDASLLGTHRREKARRFVLASMGPEAVISGISPGFEADGEFYWGNEHGASWWRVWVDVGGCAPEALPFVADPPEAYGGQVRDIVLAPDIERLEVLAVRLAERWAGRQEVRLWCPEAKTIRTVLPRRCGAGKRWAPHRRADVDALVRQRLRGSHHRSLLGKIGGRLSPDDWAMLVEIGNNPFFTAYELAYLWGDTGKGVQGRRKRVDGLESLGLLETARNAGPRYLTEGRKVLTWRGLELIAGY